MARTLSEATQFQSVTESALGTANVTGWRRHQPNTIDKFGAAFKKITRDPIGAGRQLQQGDIVDLEAPVEWTADLTMDLMNDFVEGMMMAKTKPNGGGGTTAARFVVSDIVDGAASADSFSVVGAGALQAQTLIHVKGARNKQNNGLFALVVGSDATNLKVATASVIAETPGVNYLVTAEIAGFRGAVGDITMEPATGNILCTAADFTTMGLYAGQWIWVGGTAGGANAFATHPEYRGYAQIDVIAAKKLTLKRRSWIVGTVDAGAGKQIDLYWGRWIRNTNAQSADYQETSYTFEATYATLGGAATPFYEYAFGQYLASAVFNFNSADKATVDLAFIGQGTVDPAGVASRKAGANALNVGPLAKAMFNTSVHMMRLRLANVDETGLSTDIKSLKLTLLNNVSRETVLAFLGSKYLNVGDFSATLEGEFLFTNENMVSGVRDNRIFQVEVAVRNGDGSLLFDIPSVQLDAADRKFAANMSVTLDGKISGFEDATLGFTAAVTMFPYCPAS